MNYEYGFGTWQTDMWNFWTDALFTDKPVATSMQTYQPTLQKDINDTLDAKYVAIKQFKKVPVETFESGDLNKILLTQKDLPSTSIKNTIDKSQPITGTASYLIDYPASSDWQIIARTDETKIALPAFHRYNISFDYKLLSSVATRIHLTIRPKATLSKDDVAYGYETIALKPGVAGKYSGKIDVLTASDNDVLLFIGESDAMKLQIDNLSITEG